MWNDSHLEIRGIGSVRHAIAFRRRLTASIVSIASIAAAASSSVATTGDVSGPPADDSSRPTRDAAALERQIRQTRDAKRVRVTDDNAVVRTGPGDAFALAGVFSEGTSFSVLAKRDDWYNVHLSVTETGWIHASLCEEYDDLSALDFRPNPRLYSRIGTFVVTGHAGAYGFDRKSNSLVLGGRVGYYVFDFVEIEGGVAWTHIDRPREIVESLFDLSLESEAFHMLTYNMNVTMEILPGRQMVPFVTGGVGSTIMQGDTEPTLNFGAGTMLFLSKRAAMRWEFRNHRFESGSQAARRRFNNVEFTLGTAYLF